MRRIFHCKENFNIKTACYFKCNVKCNYKKSGVVYLSEGVSIRANMNSS